MNSISPDNFSPLYQFNSEQEQRLAEYSRFKLAAVSSEQSADLTIVTKEGDRVTLSVDSSFEAAYATYNRKAQMDGVYTETRGQIRAVNAEREISITVEGDLNDAERKEIKRIMHEIFKMIKNFLSSPDEKPAVSDLKNIELDTLADVEAKIEVKKSVLQANHVSARTVTTSSIPKGESIDVPEPVDRLINRMSAAVKNSKIEHDKFLNFFDRDPSRMTDEYLNRDPGARHMRKMVRRIMATFFHQLGNSNG